MRQLGITALIELPPAGALVGSGQARPCPESRRWPSRPRPTWTPRAPSSPPPAGSGQGEHTPDFHVAITPAKGIFTRADGVDEGSPVKAGMRLGTIATNRDDFPVLAPPSGPGGDLVLAEWLRHDGDIVAAGLPVARIAAMES